MKAGAKFVSLIAASVIMAAVFTGCTDFEPELRPEYTLPPEETPSPPPTPEPTAEPTPEPTAAELIVDANGEVVSDAGHFKQYVTFRNIQVYEQEDDTFVDCIAVNSYPETILCAIGVAFYDADGTIVAKTMLQTRDAQFALELTPGETTLYGQVDTDMTLTDLDFELVFDDSFGIQPETGK